jgi:type IV secretory pathway TraG/TraD family ATPase VirD4
MNDLVFTDKIIDANTSHDQYITLTLAKQPGTQKFLVDPKMRKSLKIFISRIYNLRVSVSGKEQKLESLVLAL